MRYCDSSHKLMKIILFMRQLTEKWEICKHGKLPYSKGTSVVSGRGWERSKPTTPRCKDINKFPNEEWRFSSGGLIASTFLHTGNHGSLQQELYDQLFRISEHFPYMGSWRTPVSGTSFFLKM
ncbi:hypothetical protein CK203_057492 [Vitis vinifera]|uniref:Uncharacterized protein n=1 Tax=Vitis vinifera TaxID=29760 RepID=A0A438FT15_VITVI|nr:hypothetical protein CK203_057492 [Vitis vinifera]